MYLLGDGLLVEDFSLYSYVSPKLSLVKHFPFQRDRWQSFWVQNRVILILGVIFLEQFFESHDNIVLVYLLHR